MRKPALIIFSIFLAVASCFPHDGKTDTGSIRGAVFTTNSSGAAVLISGAQIQIKGPVAKEARSDAAGDFLIEALPTGKYDVTASVPGMSDAAQVTVIAGTTSLTSLDLASEVSSSSVGFGTYAALPQGSLPGAFCNLPFARRSRECEKQR